MRTYLNFDWQFFKQWSDNIFGQSSGETVQIPHSHAITPFNCFDESLFQNVTGYKRNLRLAIEAGNTYLLTFEGVAHRAEVFVNGVSVALHECGYTAFTVDITSHVHDGDNELVVKVDSRETLNQPPFGFVIDYMTYGGIYRDVYLEEKHGAYVKDAFVKAVPSKPIEVDITLGNFAEPTQLSAQIFDGNGVKFSSNYTCNGDKLTICANADLELWSIDNPKLYTLALTVGQDRYETTFGVRSAVFTKDGFYLNGKKIKIIGLDRHQSYPYVGYAMPESMQREDARILKNKLCLNAVRTSHYPQSHYFMDECDRLGLLVFTEIPGWQYIGDEHWKQVAKQNVVEMVQEYRNHPSIILWGVRINESLDCDELYTETNAIAHRLDPTRQTGGVRYLKHSHLLEDVYTFNDFNREGATDRKEVCSSEVPYLITEYNGHMYPTKTYDDALHRLEHTMRYVRMLDGVFAAESTCGAFGWCMFDYNTNSDFGSGDRICYHGVLDMFRNPKCAAGVFSALGSEPFLDVTFSSELGDYPEAVIDGMYCLTNCDTVKLYKAGVYIKDYTHKDSPFCHIPNPPILLNDFIGDRLITEDGISPKNALKIKRCFEDVKKYGLSKLPLKTKLTIARIMSGEHLSKERVVEIYQKYQSGWGSEANEITLEGYVDGKLAVTKKIGSMMSYTLQVTPTSTVLHENNSYDVAEVHIVARDQFGNVCPYVNRAVTLSASGAIELIGPSSVAVQGGMFGAYVKTKGILGKGILRVDDVEVEFEVK